MTRCFEFGNHGSDKFWEIRVNGNTVSLRRGKRGTEGQSKEKSFDNADHEIKESEKMISSKIRKGYKEKNLLTDSSDDYAHIQGLWKLTSCIARGDEEISSVTHLLFEGRRIKRIDPREVDGGDWDTYVLDGESSPERFTLTSEWKGKGGQINRWIDKWRYEIRDDTLRLCWPNVFGAFPDIMSERYGIETFARDAKPLPEKKKASGRLPVINPRLGTPEWNDHYEWRETELGSAGISVVSVSVFPDDPDDVIRRYSELAEWIMKHGNAIREYAASALLENYNENWNDGEAINASEFSSRLTLESIHVDTGGASVYYDDGDLFFGHSS